MKENNIKKDNTQVNVCCLCGKKFIGYGNNPDPLKSTGVCCDECNQKVIEERFKRSLEDMLGGF